MNKYEMKIYYKALGCLRRWAKNNTNSYIMFPVKFINWKFVINSIAVTGLYFVPVLCYFSLSFANNDNVGKLGKYCVGYFDLLKMIGNDIFLFIHFLLCVIFVISLNLLIFIKVSLERPRKIKI